jgi:hypothetical protein
MKKKKHRLILLLLCSSFLLMGISIKIVQAVNTDNMPAKYKLHYITENLRNKDENINKVVQKALNKWDKSNPENMEFFATGNLVQGNGWGIVSITSLNLFNDNSFNRTEGDEIPKYNEENTFNIIYKIRTKSQKLEAALDSNTEALDMLREIPANELPTDYKEKVIYKGPKQKNVLSRIFKPASAQSTPSYKLPWSSSENWTVSPGSGWHNGVLGTTGIDFIPQNTSDPTNILAIGTGNIGWICANTNPAVNNTSVEYKVANGSTFWYGHISASSLTSQRSNIAQGIVLGQLINWSFQDPYITTSPRPIGNGLTRGCGSATAKHVHIDFPSAPYTIDGYHFPTPLSPFTSGSPTVTQTGEKIVYNNGTVLNSSQGTSTCTPPSSLNTTWVIESSTSNSNQCTFNGYTKFDGNVVVKNPVTLEIGPTGHLDLNLAIKSLRIENGAKVNIKNGGKIN